MDAKQETFHLLYSRLSSISGILLYFSVLVVLHFAFRAHLPQETGDIWRNYAAFVFAFMFFHQISYPKFVRMGEKWFQFWRRNDVIFEVLISILIGLMFVLYFRYGNEPLRVILLAVAITYIPNSIISDPESDNSVTLSIVIVTCSMVYGLWTIPEKLYHILAFILVFYALFLYVSVGEIRRAVLLATTKRREAEIANANLEIALKEVSKERDAKTRFISTASHDLAQPMQAANMFFEQIVNSKNEKIRESAIINGREAFKATTDLISHMLSHLRLEADAIRPMQSKIELKELFMSLSKIYSDGATNAGIKLEFETNDFVINSDKNLLSRAIGNLIENAIRHSGGKNVRIYAKILENNFCQIQVEDDGIGINSNDADHIFEDYYQSQTSQNIGGGGFGLGLSSVKRISVLLGGDAKIDNNYKDGARFIIEIPVKSSELKAMEFAS